MELYQLDAFLAVVEERSFTKAAERVFRTQGAVSVAIRKLEEEVGVPLMARDSHECTLTEAGRMLTTYARRMIELRDKFQRSMAALRSLDTGSVGIASHESAAEYLLPAPLAAFHAQYPNVKLEARLCDGHQIAHLVSEREVDLGFGIRQNNRHGLLSEMVHSDPLVLVAAPDHRLSHEQAIDLGQLGHERLFMHSRHTTMTETIQRLFADHHVELTVAAEVWNFETMKQFVRTGSGLAIVPASVAQPDLDLGRLVTIRCDDLVITRSIEVIYRENEALLPAPAALIAILRAWQWRPDASEPIPAPLCSARDAHRTVCQLRIAGSQTLHE
jgi:DNA-binding transcriptional LysR family regulator